MSQIEGLFNFRDTGGLPRVDGGQTRQGVLYRSDALSGVTAAGLEALASTDIGVIVDFRTPQERQAAPDRLPTSRSFRAVDLSILQGAMADLAQSFFRGGSAPSPGDIAAALAQVPTLGDLYVSMLQGGAKSFVEVARLIAASSEADRTAVLVHCTAGKDRTGVATALMLEAAGAQRDAVVADYASSQANLSGPWADGMTHMMSSFGVPLTPQIVELATGTPPAAIEQALAWLDSEHGGAAAYLAAGGLSEAELAGLRSRLTA